MNKTIAIDFDGVIHKYSSWNGGKIEGGLIEGAIEGYYRLITSGYTPVVLTSRDDLEIVKNWMEEQFRFKENVSHIYDLVVTNRKIPAIAYVDDRALRFTNWPDICKYFC